MANVTKFDTFTDGMGTIRMSGTIVTIAGPYMMCLTSLGLIENAIILYVFLRHRELLLNSINILVMFLSVIDLLTSLLSLPFIAASSFANRWLFSTTGCQWYALSMTVFGVASISMLTCIALERYIVIVLNRREPPTTARARVVKYIFCCILLGLVIGICPLLGWGAYELEPGFPSCSPAWWRRNPTTMSFNVTILSCAFVVPMCTIIYAYTRIFIKIYSRTDSSVVRRREGRVAVIGLTMIVFFLLAWGPYALVAILRACCEFIVIPEILSVIPVMMAKSSVVWNPIIYLCRNEKFRQVLTGDTCIKKLIPTRQADDFEAAERPKKVPQGKARTVFVKGTDTETTNLEETFV